MFHGLGTHRRRHGQMFEKGALKYLILDLINEKPRHGYDIIQELEESSGGCYTPSPGSVYPTLQMLEDLGYISPKSDNGKKIFDITDDGREYLETHKESVDKHRQHMTECFGSQGSSEWGSVMSEMKDFMLDVGELLRQVGRSAQRGIPDKEQMGDIKNVIVKAKEEIVNIVKESKIDPKSDTKSSN